MKLADWIKDKGISRAEFARRIEVSGAMITFYCNGTVWPGQDVFERIVRETGGAVTPNDFLRDREEPAPCSA